MIYGTPSHDTDGSLEVFRKITCRYGITILEPGQAYFLNNHSGVYFVEPLFSQVMSKAVLFGIPEPRKKYLLAETSAGKDETEAAVREAMHKMCYLLSAKRREYADIPCFVLYHGEVAGTVYQNDQTIERGTGISITVDDLADIDADYYALGHIHKPQRVGKLPAYYAGSIYPKNFGETHKAGFNIVEFTPAGSYGFHAKVTRVDFPHPQNLKIESRFPDELILPDVKGKRVWLEITCTREQHALFEPLDHVADLLCNGAVEGSRVSVSIIPTETVRAAEITAVTTPADKFKVWAENSAVEAPESVIKKIYSVCGGLKLSSAGGRGNGSLSASVCAEQ
jgi:DNA repair exonuclease SbcCD nuclease subunit